MINSTLLSADAVVRLAHPLLLLSTPGTLLLIFLSCCYAAYAPAFFSLVFPLLSFSLFPKLPLSIKAELFIFLPALPKLQVALTSLHLKAYLHVRCSFIDK